MYYSLLTQSLDSKRTLRVVQSSEYVIKALFPPGQYKMAINSDNEPEHLAICPPGKLVSITVRLHKGVRCAIVGYGIPYANTKDKALEAMINDNAPLPCGLSILDIFARRTEFTFAVQTQNTSPIKRSERQHPVFTYPYGNDHSWDENKFRRLLDETKSDKPFTANLSYRDNNSFVAVNVQFNVQDSFWLDAAAREIAAARWPAYFVDSGKDGMPCMVVQMAKDLRLRVEAAWRRLTKNASLQVLVQNQTVSDGKGEDLQL
jgi:hypothetical protein